MRHTPRPIECGRLHPRSVERFQSYVETGVKLAGLAHNIYKAGKFVAPLIAAL